MTNVQTTNWQSNLHHCIDELMCNPSISMFVKSFTLFTYYIIHNNAIRRLLQCVNHMYKTPWKDLHENPKWIYHNLYSNHTEEGMTEEEKKRQWYAYLDFWFEDCLKSKFFYLEQVQLNPDVLDIGVFVIKLITSNDSKY